MKSSYRPEMEFIPFALPSIEQEEIAEIIHTLRSGWITTGLKVKKFEEEFARYVGCKHAIALNSCTAALHLALEAIGLDETSEVLTSPMTFAATAEVVRYFGAHPVFVDIDPVRMNMDVHQLEEALRSRQRDGKGKKLKAIMPVHFGGYPCPMNQVQALANQHGIRVIEDAAHAFPSYYQGRMIGTVGDITCFSFYATKNITTGEGGMVTTENDEWGERMRIMGLHGISKDAWKRYRADGNWFYEVVAPGFKYNMTDIAASLGIAQLKKAEVFWERRCAIARRYDEGFREIEEIERPAMDEDGKGKGSNGGGRSRNSWHLYPIRLKLHQLSVGRDQFIEELRGRGIGTSVHFIPLHLHPYYRDTYGYRPEDFPVALETYRRILSLPIYPRMTDRDVERVIDAVGEVAKKYRKRSRLVNAYSLEAGSRKPGAIR